jgi:hypothetical protein
VTLCKSQEPVARKSTQRKCAAAFRRFAPSTPLSQRDTPLSPLLSPAPQIRRLRCVLFATHGRRITVPQAGAPWARRYAGRVGELVRPGGPAGSGVWGQWVVKFDGAQEDWFNTGRGGARPPARPPAADSFVRRADLVRGGQV